MSCDTLNLLMPEFRALCSHSVALGSTLCFPKQHFESIVPSKPGINTVESFIFVGLKFRGFQISDKLVGI